MFIRPLAPLLVLILIGCGTGGTTDSGAVATPPPPLTLTLDATEQSIIGAARSRSDAAIALLEETVRIPSATSNHEGVRNVGRVFARELESLGFTTRWIEAPAELNRAGHLIAERQGNLGRRLLLIGHLDTVIDGGWFERDGNMARASGGADMKGGNVIIVEALRAMNAAGTLDGHQIIVFLTGDEEEGGRPLALARAPLIEAARRSDVALAFEGTAPGTVTVGRRGIEQWIVEVEARTGHSSGIFGRGLGYGASFEAARVVNGFREALAGQPNVSLNPAIIISGSNTEFDPKLHRGATSGVTNIIADKAVIEGDVRYLTTEQREQIMKTMEQVAHTGNLPHTSSRIRWNEGYPSMPPTQANYHLARILDGASRDMGMEPIQPGDPGRRGAGDVSFVAPYVDALDGLGAMGSRSHTIDELVQLDTLADIAARVAVLMHRLTDPDRMSQVGLETN